MFGCYLMSNVKSQVLKQNQLRTQFNNHISPKADTNEDMCPSITEKPQKENPSPEVISELLFESLL